MFDYKKKDHVFRIQTISQASYLLEAETLEDMTAWIGYLDQSAKIAMEDGQPFIFDPPTLTTRLTHKTMRESRNQSPDPWAEHHEKRGQRQRLGGFRQKIRGY